MNLLQRRILAVTLSLTIAVFVAYALIAILFLGFSFGSFVLYALFPLLVVYFTGMVAFRAAGRRSNEKRPG